MTDVNVDGGEQRKVGAALGIGILLLPFVFAWFTLRKGYSKFARIVSLAWMAVIIFAIVGKAEPSPQETATEEPQVAEISDKAEDASVDQQATVKPEEISKASLESERGAKCAAFFTTAREFALNSSSNPDEGLLKTYERLIVKATDYANANAKIAGVAPAIVDQKRQEFYQNISGALNRSYENAASESDLDMVKSAKSDCQNLFPPQ